MAIAELLECTRPFTITFATPCTMQSEAELFFVRAKVVSMRWQRDKTSVCVVAALAALLGIISAKFYRNKIFREWHTTECVCAKGFTSYLRERYLLNAHFHAIFFITTLPSCYCYFGWCN